MDITLIHDGRILADKVPGHVEGNLVDTTCVLSLSYVKTLKRSECTLIISDGDTSTEVVGILVDEATADYSNAIYREFDLTFETDLEPEDVDEDDYEDEDEDEDEVEEDEDE